MPPKAGRAPRSTKSQGGDDATDNRNIRNLYDLPLSEKRELLYIWDEVEFNHEITEKLNNDQITDACILLPSSVSDA